MKNFRRTDPRLDRIYTLIYNVYMRRYQIYLNTQSVKAIDAFQKEVKLSRSRIIRSAIDALAENLTQALPPQKKERGALDSLLGLLGTVKSKGTNFARNVDEIYSID